VLTKGSRPDEPRGGCRVGLCSVLNECPVALFRGRITSANLRIKGLSRGPENINDLFPVNKATGHSFNVYYAAQNDSLHTLCLVCTLIHTLRCITSIHIL
jgi:hypothetical protein